MIKHTTYSARTCKHAMTEDDHAVIHVWRDKHTGAVSSIDIGCNSIDGKSALVRISGGALANLLDQLARIG